MVDPGSTSSDVSGHAGQEASVDEEKRSEHGAWFLIGSPRVKPFPALAGESGNNLGRAVAVQAGLDRLPGVTARV